MSTTEKKRNSNLELLRIISIILIIAHHYAGHGFVIENMPYSFNQYLIGFLVLGGKLGVVCFILISGFFMCETKFSIKKLIKLIGEAWFYLLVIGILFNTILTPTIPIDFTVILKSTIPIIYDQNWFITDYIMLMIISPVLNIIIKNISKESYQKMLIIGFILYSVLPIFIFASLNNTSFVGFIYLYFVAGYMRKFLQVQNSPKRYFLKASIINFMVILSSILFIFLGHKFNLTIFIVNNAYFSSLNSPFTLLIGIELFIFFLKLKPFTSKIINKIASTTLGIYLIHDNFLLRPYLWGGGILNNLNYVNSPFLFLHAIISIIGVFIVCVIIDLIRQETVEKVYLKIVDKLILFYQKKNLNIYKKIWYYISKIID